jgi:hypothetical protein
MIQSSNDCSPVSGFRFPSPNRTRTRTGATDAACGDGVRGGESEDDIGVYR